MSKVLKMVTKFLKISWPYLFLAVFVLVFFHKLFFPLSIFTTPGDIAYFNYPLKNFLSESLKQHQLPLWTSYIGTGFPLLADSPIGVFYLPNLILYFLLPTPIAFNLTYILTFFIAGVSTFILARNYKLSTIASLYAALAYSFSGFFIARIIHTSFIQLAALFPLSLFLIEKYIEKNRIIYLLLLSILISQMVFIGYPQGVLYSLFASYLYLIGRIYFINPKDMSRSSALFFTTILLGMLLSAVQIFPSLELLRFSSRSGGLEANQLFMNSGSPKILLLFFYPFLFGNPSHGQTPRDIGYYWENIAFSGTLTPILAFIAVFIYKKNRIVLILGLLALLITVLALGINSPTHILFDIPPFSIFRIPARLLYITSLLISILSAFFITKIESKKGLRWIGLVFLAILIIQVYFYWYNFNTYSKKEYYLKKPGTASFLKKELGNKYRFSSFWPYLQKPLLIQDWNQDSQKYLEDFVFLNPDLNMVYQIPSTDFYTSLYTRRLSLIRELYGENIDTKTENGNKIFSLKPTFIKLLNYQEVRFLISRYEIGNKELQEKFTLNLVTTNSKGYVYELEDALPRIRMAKKASVAETVSDLAGKINSMDLSAENVLFETEPPTLEKEFNNYKISDIKDTQNKLTFTVENDGDGYLVISDSYYPGWEAKVNSQSSRIYPVDINSRGIYIKEGINKVELTYKPKSFLIGGLITLFSHIAILILLIKLKFFNRSIKLLFSNFISLFKIII